MTSDHQVSGLFGMANYLFVTSTTYLPGSLGGLTGADQACQGRAQAGGLKGTYVAWLATASAGAPIRLKGARGFIRPDGKPFADILDPPSAVLYPPRIDEFGRDAMSGLVATGSLESGSVYANQTSADWTDMTIGYAYGALAGGYGKWTFYGTASGNTPSHLYCAGIDFRAPLVVTKETGRLAFVTAGTFNASLGLSGADSLCATEATANAVSGTFLALLATPTASAASRFSTSGTTWVRPDGVPILAQASDLVTGRFIAPLDVTLSGSYTFRLAWTGSTAPNSLGTNTCTGWTSNASTVTAQAGYAAFSDGAFFNAFGLSCNANVSLYCLEQ
jgi:hypothetical protein